MSIRIPPRDTKEVTPEERKQLADFFMALMDLRQEQNVTKGPSYEQSNK